MSAVVDSVTLAVADAVDNDCATQEALKIIENIALERIFALRLIMLFIML